MAGLLFLAFAYFAVGQAAVNRNGAQTAADAAALAAAQETREQLFDRWRLVLRDPTKWQDIFNGDVLGLASSCPRASELAHQNGASLQSCHEPDVLRTSVTVQADKTAGDSVIPVTSTTRAHASAVAVIDSLCTFELPSGGSQDGGGGGDGAGDAGGAGGDGGDDAEVDVLPTLTCDGGTDWEPDPQDPTGLPGPEDLFDVHLATG